MSTQDVQDIQVPVLSGTVMPEPPTTSTELVPVAPAQVTTIRKQLVCKDLLKGDTLTQAKQEAAEAYKAMRENPVVLQAYGNSDLKGLNDLVDQMMDEVEPVKIPELDELIRGMSREMRSIKKKYDISDPKVREKYERFRKGFLSRWFGAKEFLAQLKDDATSVQKHLDNVDNELAKRQEELNRNVAFYAQLHDENELEIKKLIYRIGVMELILDIATEDMQSIVVGDAALGDRQGEVKAQIAQFVSNLEVKIGEFKGRYMLAHAVSPQTRQMQGLSEGLGNKIGSLRVTALPAFKETIVQWYKLVSTSDAAKISELVASTTNEAIQMFSEAGAEMVPQIADSIYTPTLTPQTIAALADSFAKQTDGLIAAMERGEERRKENEAAMVDAIGVIADASKKLSDSTIARVLTAANKPLEIETSVPASS